MAITPEASIQDCFRNCINLLLQGEDIQKCIEDESRRIVIELPKIKMSNQLMDFFMQRIQQASSQAESDRLKITIGNIPTIV